MDSTKIFTIHNWYFYALIFFSIRSFDLPLAKIQNWFNFVLHRMVEAFEIGTYKNRHFGGIL